MAGYTAESTHAALMDGNYKYQRYVYDATRKYYLLGRDRLIGNLDAKSEDRILEIACGTGRNLAAIAARYPDVTLYGLDISREMLRSAEHKLGAQARLAQGDACDFDAELLFAQPQFDRVVLSYSASMIPQWQRALQQAFAVLAPGGELHVVDFSDQAGLPRCFAGALRLWLAKFHVTPRVDLHTVLQALAIEHDAGFYQQSLYRGYSQYVRLKKPS